MTIIVASVVVAAFFYYRTLTPYWQLDAIVVPAIPFMLLTAAVFIAPMSRLLPAISTLAVAFAGVAFAFHWVTIRDRNPMDPDPDMVGFPLVFLILPIEVMLACAMLLAAIFERRKRL